MRRSLSASFVVLFTVATLTFTGVQPASAAPPAVGSNWPMCGGTTQYCIESFSVDGVSSPAGWVISVWRVTGPPDDSGETLVDWNVSDGTDSNSTIAPANAGAQIAFTVNMGPYNMRYTTARTTNLVIARGGNATDGYTFSVSGVPMRVHWWMSGAGGLDCFQNGNCGGSTTAADETILYMIGGTQTIDGWDPDDQTYYGGQYSATDAEWGSIIPDLLYNDDDPAHPFWYWQITLSNPHFQIDGTTPVVGNYTAYIPHNLIARVGLTPAEAAALGLQIVRVDGSSISVIGGAVMETPDGGLYMNLPSVSYSRPTLKFRPPRGTVKKILVPPYAPKGVTTQALDGRAVIHFKRPFFNGGGPLTRFRVHCVNGGTAHDVWTTNVVAVEVTGLTNSLTWQCNVQAGNASKLGRFSYPVPVTPASGLPAIKPGATPLIKIAQKPGRALAVAWAVPSSTGGSALLKYHVDICPVPRSCPRYARVSRTNLASNRSIYVGPGVLARGYYRIFLRASNAKGYGDVAIVTFKIV